MLLGRVGELLRYAAQRRIGELAGQRQSEVSEIARGRTVLSYDTLVRIADGLGVPRGYLGCAYDETTAPLVEGYQPPDEVTEDMKRRITLALAAWAAVGKAVLGGEVVDIQRLALRPMRHCRPRSAWAMLPWCVP